MENDAERLALESARFRYEWAGDDPPVLAERFDLPLVVIENAITEGDWNRKLNLPVAMAKKNVDDLKDLSLQVAEESRLSILVYEQSSILKILELKSNLLAQTEAALESPELTIQELKRLTEIQDIMYKQTLDNINAKPIDSSVTFKADQLQVNIKNEFSAETLQ